MKKMLAFVLGALAIYAAYGLFYRPNLLINTRFSRGPACWQFASGRGNKIVAPEKTAFTNASGRLVRESESFLRLTSGQVAAQSFLSAIVPGQACLVSLEARAKDSPATLDFLLDANLYAVMNVTNRDWRPFRFRFPVFDYADKRTFKLSAGGLGAIEFRNPALRRSNPLYPVRYESLEGAFLENLLCNGDFYAGTNGWEFDSPGAFSIGNRQGINCLEVRQASNIFHEASQEIRLGRGAYTLTCYAMMLDNRMDRRIANCMVIYEDERGRSRRVGLRFNGTLRNAWAIGREKLDIKKDCQAKIILRCESSLGKTPGKVLFYNPTVRQVIGN